MRERRLSTWPTSLAAPERNLSARSMNPTPTSPCPIARTLGFLPQRKRRIPAERTGKAYW
jgi:hypothetical protein